MQGKRHELNRSVFMGDSFPRPTLTTLCSYEQQVLLHSGRELRFLRAGEPTPFRAGSRPVSRQGTTLAPQAQ